MSKKCIREGMAPAMTKLAESHFGPINLNDEEREAVIACLASEIRMFRHSWEIARVQSGCDLEAVMSLPVVSKRGSLDPLSSIIFRVLVTVYLAPETPALDDLMKLGWFVQHLVHYLADRDVIIVRRVG